MSTKKESLATSAGSSNLIPSLLICDSPWLLAGVIRKSTTTICHDTAFTEILLTNRTVWKGLFCSIIHGLVSLITLSED